MLDDVLSLISMLGVVCLVTVLMDLIAFLHEPKPKPKEWRKWIR